MFPRLSLAFFLASFRDGVATLTILSFLVLCPPAHAQTGTPVASGTAILTQSLKAAGGSAGLGSIQDFVATGAITFYWAGEQVQGPATVYGKGYGEFRLDASLPQGMRSFALSYGTGALKDSSGKVTTIPYQNTVNLGILTFPYLTLAAALSDPLTTVSYLGLVEVSGRQAYQVQVQRHFSPQADSNGTLAGLCVTSYFVDAQTNLLLEVSDATHPVETFTANYTHDIELGDYVTQGGYQVPMVAREKVGGQTMWQLQLSGIAFNTGLTDATFLLQ
jgi:hypothetical protein